MNFKKFHDNPKLYFSHSQYAVCVLFGFFDLSKSLKKTIGKGFFFEDFLSSFPFSHRNQELSHQDCSILVWKFWVRFNSDLHWWWSSKSVDQINASIGRLRPTGTHVSLVHNFIFRYESFPSCQYYWDCKLLFRNLFLISFELLQPVLIQSFRFPFPHLEFYGSSYDDDDDDDLSDLAKSRKKEIFFFFLRKFSNELGLSSSRSLTPDRSIYSGYWTWGQVLSNFFHPNNKKKKKKDTCIFSE